MRILSRLLLLALAARPGDAAQVPDSQTTTLREAMALAARHDPNVIQAQGGVRGAGAGVRTAWGAFLPSITGSASGGSSFSEGPGRPDPITGEILSGDVSSQSAAFGVSAQVELFDGFRRNAALRAAHGAADQAQAALDESLAQSALQTSGIFLTALQSSELVAVRRETVQRAEEQLTIATARLATRAATVQDSLRALVQLGQARLDLVTETARLTGAEANLARRLGLPGRIAARDDGTLTVLDQPPDADALLTEALSRAPQVTRTEAAIRAAEGQLSAARAQYWPSLLLSGSYDYAGSDRNDFTFYNNRSVRLGVSWPLFNGFRREEQVARSAATLDAERARAADARREVAANLTGQIAALEAARQRIELTRLSVEAARADVLVALERYRLGSISINDLNLSQDGLTRAQESAVSARIEYLRAKAEIEAILGRPL